MLLNIAEEERALLLAALQSAPDAEAVGEGEFVLDLFNEDPPLTVELAFDERGADVLAAEIMKYDQAMDGWYIAGRAQDAQVREALRKFAREYGQE